jgi:hypothetical protein
MYAEPAREYILRRGGEVRTGAAARVAIAAGRVSAVTTDGERWTAPVVIAAVPWFALPELFDGDTTAIDSVIAAARKTAPSPIVTVNLWLDRPILERPFIGLPGRTFQWVFDKRLVFGDSASHLSLVSSGAADVLMRSNADVIAHAEQEIQQALPPARSARTLRATVIREPRATFSLAPGQPPRPQTTTAVDGLWLAGDWIETGLPATIESAVRSGHAAAAAALERVQRAGNLSRSAVLQSFHPAIHQ